MHDGVASYGRRPTFGGGEPVLETFLFDFSGDLYGETALVAFYGFIRPEQRFDSVEALVSRMDADSIDARAMLERTPPGEMDTRLYSGLVAEKCAGNRQFRREVSFPCQRRLR